MRVTAGTDLPPQPIPVPGPDLPGVPQTDPSLPTRDPRPDPTVPDPAPPAPERGPDPVLPPDGPPATEPAPAMRALAA